MELLVQPAVPEEEELPRLHRVGDVGDVDHGLHVLPVAAVRDDRHFFKGNAGNPSGKRVWPADGHHI